MYRVLAFDSRNYNRYVIYCTLERSRALPCRDNRLIKNRVKGYSQQSESSDSRPDSQADRNRRHAVAFLGLRVASRPNPFRVRHNLIHGDSCGRNLHSFNEREGMEIASRPRRAKRRRTCGGSPSCFLSQRRVSKCKSNRPARRNYDSRVETAVLLSRTGTIVLPWRCRAKRAGAGHRRAGAGGARAGPWKREEVNQFESPGSDPAARKIGRPDCALQPRLRPSPFVTWRKARVARACGMATARFHAPPPRPLYNQPSGFSGVSTGRTCTVFVEIVAPPSFVKCGLTRRGDAETRG